MKRGIQSIRAFFVPRENPYAGGDLKNAQRLGALLWSLVVVLIAVAWIPSPPTEAIGSAGWAIAIAIVLCGAGLVAAMRRGKLVTSWNGMLAIAYGSVIALSILMWLAGGVGTPYERMLLLPVLFVATLHPPRKILAFLGVVAIALAAPFVYDGWNQDAAGATFVTFVIWTALAMLGNVLMSGVRAQRLAAAAHEAQARQEARVDTLTGLHNRRAFDEALDREVSRARRESAELTVAMIDIQNFKEINDGFGHAEGDRCLREVGQAIEGAMRRPEMCFRWGGDEFALLLAGTGAGAAIPLGTRLKGEVYRRCRRPGDEPMEISFAVAELADGMTAGELGEMAGMALTAAKAEAHEAALDEELDS